MALYDSYISRLDKSFQVISSVFEANKMKKNATMLKRFLPDEVSSNTSIFFMCFSDYFEVFCQVVYLSAVNLYG